jgi:hypothetical protein
MIITIIIIIIIIIARNIGNILLIRERTFPIVLKAHTPLYRHAVSKATVFFLRSTFSLFDKN